MDNFKYIVKDSFSNIVTDVGAIAEVGSSIATLKAEVVKAKSAKQQAMATSGCKKPAINVFGAKKKYLACIQKFNASNQDAKTAELQYALAEKKLDAAISQQSSSAQLESARLNADISKSANTFLGMPKEIGMIAVGGGVLIMITVLVLVLKK